MAQGASTTAKIMLTSRPQCMTRIDTRLENFLARQLAFEEIEVYEQEACVEEITGIPSFMKKYPFRVLIVCKDRLYITDNPPRNLDNFISFDDILEIKIIDDVPKFLKGNLQRDALHLSIVFSESITKKRDLVELRKKVLGLKKNILYEKIVDDKIVSMELTAPLSSRLSENNTFRSINFDLRSMDRTNRSETYNKKEINTNQNLLTNRTFKSVHFNDETYDENKDDSLRNENINNRYQKLLEITKQTSTINKDNFENQDPLSLSFPMTSRTLDLNSLFSSNEITYMSREQTKSMEDLYNKVNLEFIQDSEKKKSLLHLYILNSKSKIFETLKSAHFYSKIRATLNFHQETKDIKTFDSKNTNSNKTINHTQMEKKFRQLKSEILTNIDDLEKTAQLLDELLCATNTHSVLKRFFWLAQDFYQLLVTQIVRYLPKSPANMTSGSKKAASRRIKELECCVALVETLSMMLSETEFFQNRNEVLSHEKCQFLARLVPLLLAEPELAVLRQIDSDSTEWELHRSMQESVNDLCLVSAILLWEILTFLKLNSWTNEYFNYDICIQIIENSKSLSVFVQCLIGELSRIITYNPNILLSPQQTIIIFKVFGLLKYVIDKSKKKVLKNLLKDKYQEEFKYYFSEQRIKSRCFDYYPIIEMLLSTVKILEDSIV